MLSSVCLFKEIMMISIVNTKKSCCLACPVEEMALYMVMNKSVFSPSNIDIYSDSPCVDHPGLVQYEEVNNGTYM